MNCECPHCFHLFNDVDNDPQRHYHCPDCAVVLTLIQTDTGPTLKSTDQFLVFDSKSFLIKWCLAIIIASVIGMVVTRGLGSIVTQFLYMSGRGNIGFGFVNSQDIVFGFYIIFSNSISGCLLAVAQWKVLRDLARPFQNWFWITAAVSIAISVIYAISSVDAFRMRNIFPFFTGNVFFRLIPAFFQSLLFGALLGTAQWLLLRQVAKRAAWWILACATVNVFSILSYFINIYYIEFQQDYDNLALINLPFVIAGVHTIFGEGIILGLVLIWLLKQPVAQFSIMENSLDIE